MPATKTAGSNVKSVLPRANEAHIRLLALDQQTGDVNQLLPLLSPDERDRAGRFYFAQHREDFIRCRAWLRQVLAEYLEREPPEVAFRYEKFGKPVLSNPGAARLSFNLSHSQRHAVLAVARECPIGIDIEWINPAYDFNAVAPFVLPFHARMDMEFYSCEPHELRCRRFFAWWARTEAVLKASGVGFATNARADELDGYVTHDLKLVDGYAAALAYPRSRGELKLSIQV